MTLSFPNPSRSFDLSRNAISFVGYDNLAVITFYLDAGALGPLNEGADSKDKFLSAFDRQKELIHNAARRVYSRGKSSFYLLTATDI